MSEPRRIAWLVAAWAVFLGLYAGVSFYLKPGVSLSAFGDIVQCFVPLIANAGLLINAGTPHWRRNIFWMLLALSCSMWMMGQFEWTYYEIYLHREVPDPFAGDIIFFLRGIPLIAALALQPHLKREELRMGLGYLDFALLLAWWTFVYAFFVLPWMYVSYSAAVYNYAYNVLNTLQQLVVIVGFGIFWLRTRNAWRTVYAYLFTASALYMLSSLTSNVAISRHDYYTGSLYDLPLLTVFFLYGLAGLVAFQRRTQLDLPADGSMAGGTEGVATGNVWASRLAMGAVMSLPLFALYAMHLEHDTRAIRDFRLTVTLVAAVPLVLLVFLRTHLADKDRALLLAKSESSIENLQRLQAQLVQSEKLISLGQLAAGAAHEINNPLTAILGYSDLLADDPALPDRARTTAGKIREQARRTRNLVQNLLSFARQVPPERTLLDINSVISNAVQLRALDLHKGGPRIETELESVLPGVRGDNNQLMQVFFNIVNNGLDAMGDSSGGVLTIKTLRDRGSVVILFSDNGPGIREPHRVFDPFYTTKPVGKGTGLGLSICYGIVQEHGGKILCYNGQTGGAVFRVELPAVLAVLPSRGPVPPSAAPVSSKQS
ncbi:MAG TPA: HAMP domain-containing sensor histidine kinase [Candidatus Acidoferrum sp.]|jgi:signal transduction histidine kinase|nr:HAMP domain-containing sensor histidine kinase [Candidatus Acidoferrum sp.]